VYLLDKTDALSSGPDGSEGPEGLLLVNAVDELSSKLCIFMIIHVALRSTVMR